MNARFSLRPHGSPAGIDPRHWREALAARIEWHATALDRLIAALDRMDGDADLEPSLGAPEMHPRAGGAILPCRDNDGAQLAWSTGGVFDLENDAVEDDEADNPITLNPDRRSRDRRFYRAWQAVHPAGEVKP